MSTFNPNLDVEPFARDLTINVLSEVPVVGLVMGPVIGLFWTEAPLPRILTIGEVTDIASATYHKLSGEKEYVTMLNLVKGYKKTFYEALSNYTKAMTEIEKEIRMDTCEGLPSKMHEMFDTHKAFDCSLEGKRNVSAELTLVPFIGFACIHLALLSWLRKNNTGGFQLYEDDLKVRRDEYREHAKDLVVKMKNSRESTISEVITNDDTTITAGGFLSAADPVLGSGGKTYYFTYGEGVSATYHDISNAGTDREDFLQQQKDLIDKQAEPYLQQLNPLTPQLKYRSISGDEYTQITDCVDYVAYGEQSILATGERVNDGNRIAGVLRRITGTYTWIETNEIGGILHPDAAISSTSGDLIGDYTSRKYDKEGWYQVTISKVTETTFTWTNGAGVSWTLTATPDKSTLLVGVDCPYFKKGHQHVTIVWAGDHVSGLRFPFYLGPPASVELELYEKSGHSGATSSSPSAASGGLIGMYDEVTRSGGGVWLIPYTGPNHYYAKDSFNGVEYNKPDYDPRYAVHIKSYEEAVSFPPTDVDSKLRRDKRRMVLAFSSGDTEKGIFPVHGTHWVPSILYKKPVEISGDLIGDYECHTYDNTENKNDYHYVTISKVDETTLTWKTRGTVSWTLTLTPDKTKLRIGEDCLYFRRGFIEHQTVVWAGDEVSGVCGPSGEIYDKTGDHSHLGVKLKNVITNRYLFSAGDVVTSSAASSAPVLGADTNYYNRADWLLKRVGDGYTLKNRETRRYLRSEGEPVQGAEGGWLNSPPVVDTGGNFDGGHIWELIEAGDNYQLRNRLTGRYLFMTGEPVKEVEGGWLNSPGVVGADDNYYNRAIWAIEGPGTEQIT